MNHTVATIETAVDSDHAYFVYAKKSPDKGGKWQMLFVDTLDDEALAHDGFNVVGTYRVADLDFEDLAELASLAGQRELSADREQALGALLAGARTAQPGACFDLDFKTDAAAADEAQAMIERVLPGLRVAYSSGPSKPSRHMECLFDTRCWSPHLPQAAFEWAKGLMFRAGFVPRAGDRKQRFWCLPRDSGGTRGFVDLSNFNRTPSARGSLLRPLGGLTKNGLDRKTLCPGSPPTRPTVLVPRAALERAELAAQVDAKRVDRMEKAAARDRKLEPILGTGPPSDALGRFLATQAKPGDHHDLRMALAAAAINKRLGTRKLWVRAMTEAWGDADDAAAAWDSTALRLRNGQATRGIGYVRQALGGAHMVQLVAALAASLGLDFMLVLERLGLPRTYVPSELATTIRSSISPERTTKKRRMAEDALPTTGQLRTVLAQRVERVQFCAMIRRDERCLDCAKGRCSHHLTCQTPQLCSRCTFTQVRRLGEWCEEHWPNNARYQISTGTFDTREEAVLRRKQLHNPLAQIAPIAPGASGSPGVPPKWRLTIVTLAQTTSACAAANLPSVWATKREALSAFAEALLGTWACVRDLLERGRHEDAAQLLAQLYGKHTTGRSRCSESLPWPRAKDLRAEAKAKMEAKRRAEPDACACPTPGVYDHVYEPTNTMLAEATRFPMPFKEAVGVLRKGADAGYLEVTVEKIETPCLRL